MIGTDEVVRRFYRLVAPPPTVAGSFALPSGQCVPRFVIDDARGGDEEARRFFARLPAPVELSGKRVLDLGCGAGDLCFEVRRRGAAAVLGVDLSPDTLALADARLEAFDDSAIRFRRYGGSLAELGDERFDVILSKDAFEHYGADPATPSAEQIVHDAAEHLIPGGLFVIGFGPLWKAPMGGHIRARLPWVHLVFPEDVIFEEFRRANPHSNATTFEAGAGVNRMTYARFERVMRDSPFEPVGVRVNVSDHPVVRLFSLIRSIRPLREYVTQNVYGVWRLPT
jgi:SAM-dependent methyltransferase